MNYNRIQAFHTKKNPASGKVLLKAGMKYEGTLRQSFLYDDCIMYAILKEEYSH
jgi:ribosomal-protein-alanine N-acetyltransferase